MVRLRLGGLDLQSQLYERFQFDQCTFGRLCCFPFLPFSLLGLLITRKVRINHPSKKGRPSLSKTHGVQVPPMKVSDLFIARQGLPVLRCNRRLNHVEAISYLWVPEQL